MGNSISGKRRLALIDEVETESDEMEPKKAKMGTTLTMENDFLFPMAEAAEEQPHRDQ